MEVASDAMHKGRARRSWRTEMDEPGVEGMGNDFVLISSGNKGDKTQHILYISRHYWQTVELMVQYAIPEHKIT